MSNRSPIEKVQAALSGLQGGFDAGIHPIRAYAEVLGEFTAEDNALAVHAGVILEVLVERAEKLLNEEFGKFKQGVLEATEKRTRELTERKRELTEDEAHNVDKIRQAALLITAVLAPDVPANLRDSFSRPFGTP